MCFFHQSRIWRKNVVLLLKKSREVCQNCILSVRRMILGKNNSFWKLFDHFRGLKKKLLNICENYGLRSPKRDLCAQRKVLSNRSISFIHQFWIYAKLCCIFGKKLRQICQAYTLGVQWNVLKRKRSSEKKYNLYKKFGLTTNFFSLSGGKISAGLS